MCAYPRKLTLSLCSDGKICDSMPQLMCSYRGRSWPKLWPEPELAGAGPNWPKLAPQQQQQRKVGQSPVYGKAAVIQRSVDATEISRQLLNHGCTKITHSRNKHTSSNNNNNISSNNNNSGNNTTTTNNITLQQHKPFLLLRVVLSSWVRTTGGLICSRHRTIVKAKVSKMYYVVSHGKTHADV
ncbi:unnamed protein product [Polarella glacialis]|uniref:Uncharacterized protein n=1 Tax=Polarella glacialis TaxID=89957 RepID=A0A813IXZ3_POLGL|nr:unnamed protein product [Polarella glacialis]CAE8658870.1 unnamed protein product [Polarella glacialis]